MDSRYSRQIQIPSFSLKGQEALIAAKILIIGCGGLGCPVALYLTRAGVKHLGIVDDDVVQLSNLHRQVLFSESDLGRLKVEAAKDNLLQGDESLDVETYITRLDSSNYQEIISKYDVVLDCTDNFSTRYLINDACLLLNKPVVYGAANKLEGQVAVFNLNGSGHLRDLYPEIPTEGSIQNCEEAGVLGVITGIIGNFMALEVVKIVSGIGQPLVNQLVQFDGTTSRFHSIKYVPNPRTQPIEISNAAKEVSWANYLENYEHYQLVDVRTSSERNESHSGGLHIPLDELLSRKNELESYDSIAFYCQTGPRAIKAANLDINKNQQSIAIVGVKTPIASS
jgi:sulfur-carrier protein adenylyltransferase/sulfurtransferase